MWVESIIWEIPFLFSQEAEVTTQLSNLHSQHCNTHRKGGEEARTIVGPLNAGKNTQSFTHIKEHRGCTSSSSTWTACNSNRIDGEAAPCSSCLWTVLYTHSNTWQTETCVLFLLSGRSRVPAIWTDCIHTNIFNTQSAINRQEAPKCRINSPLPFLSLLGPEKLLLIDSKQWLQRRDQSGLLNQNAFLLSHVLTKLRDYTG